MVYYSIYNYYIDGHVALQIEFTFASLDWQNELRCCDIRVA